MIVMNFFRKLGEYIGVDIVGRCGDYSDAQIPPDEQYRFVQIVSVLQLQLQN